MSEHVVLQILECGGVTGVPTPPPRLPPASKVISDAQKFSILASFERSAKNLSKYIKICVHKNG